MVVQFVKFRSGLPDPEVRGMMKDRLPLFEAFPGLVRKYYVHDPRTGEYGGIYFWESEEALAKFRESDLARGIAGRYRVEGEPRVEVMDVILALRDPS